MKRQSNDADGRLAVTSRGCGHAGLPQSEGRYIVGGWEDVWRGSRLLLEKLASGVVNDRFRQKSPGERHKTPVYAAMVNRMDYNVGRILDRLNELGLSEKTIVIFTSDNGGVDFDQRSIVPTSNLPLRSGKGTLYEGGLRVPLLIRWPERRPGITGEFTTSEDFYPTFAAMFSAESNEDGESPAWDGISLMPLIDNPTATLRERTLYWHFPHYYPRMTPGSALRHGDWKLLHYYEDNPPEVVCRVPRVLHRTFCEMQRGAGGSLWSGISSLF